MYADIISLIAVRRLLINYLSAVNNITLTTSIRLPTVLFFFFFLKNPPPPKFYPLPLPAPLPIYKGFARNIERPLRPAPEDPERPAGRRPRPQNPLWARVFRARRHAEAHHRPLECGSARRARR